MAGFSQYSKRIYSSKWTAEGDIGLKKKIHFYHVTLILNQWYGGTNTQVFSDFPVNYD